MLNFCFIAQCLTKSLDSKTHLAPIEPVCRQTFRIQTQYLPSKCCLGSVQNHKQQNSTMKKEHVLINFCQETWAPNEVIPRQITSRPPTQNRGKVIRVDIS